MVENIKIERTNFSRTLKFPTLLGALQQSDVLERFLSLQLLLRVLGARIASVAYPATRPVVERLFFVLEFDSMGETVIFCLFSA